jgi:hypothetical protein
VRRTRTGLIAAALLLALAGCGSGSDTEDDDDAALAPLLDRVPGEAYVVRAMDMATAKRQLGVAGDLDPERYNDRLASATPEERFDLSALEILDYLYIVSPLDPAIDHARVTAGVRATMTPGGELKILRTSQPREEIARGLAKAGLRRRGENGFVFAEGKDAFGLTAVALGDGLVVLATTIDIATRVLRRTEPDPRLAPLRRLLDETRGAFRTAYAYRADSLNPESACLRGVAGGQLFTAGNEDEDLVLLLVGEPRASEVTLGLGSQRQDPLTKPYRVTDISRSGQTLALKVRTAPGARSQAHAAAIAAGTVPAYLVYRCPGAAAARARREVESRRTILPESPEPDRSGSRLETVISNYVARLSTAPTAVRVRCPLQTLPAGTRRLRCRGTRPHKGRRFHYTLRVAFGPKGAIESVSIDTPDDTTGTIVTKPGEGEEDEQGEPDGADGT